MLGSARVQDPEIKLLRQILSTLARFQEFPVELNSFAKPLRSHLYLSARKRCNFSLRGVDYGLLKLRFQDSLGFAPVHQRARPREGRSIPARGYRGTYHGRYINP
jgi:hypothetical protein